MKDEALRLALEALNDRASLMKWQKAREAVEQALGQPKQKDEKGRPVTYWGGLEQPEPEPVAWGVDWGKAGDSPCVSIIKRLPGGGIEVVAVEYGPKREWQGLTDEELKPICDEYRILFGYWINDFARAIEAKLKEKNDVS